MNAEDAEEPNSVTNHCDDSDSDVEHMPNFHEHEEGDVEATVDSSGETLDDEGELEPESTDYSKLPRARPPVSASGRQTPQRPSEQDQKTQICPVCFKSLMADNQEFNAHIDFCLSRGAIRDAQVEASGRSSKSWQWPDKGKGTASVEEQGKGRR